MDAVIAQLIVIVGETASGKTDLAIKIAHKYNGEIIAADSRTIYKGMDIGTAKPTEEEKQGIPHYLLDVIAPDQKYSAAEFKKAATSKIEEISARGKLPIMVGGSGLYVDSVLFDYKFQSPNLGVRAELEDLSLEQLQARAHELGIEETEIDFKNRRHLSRAIENKKVLKNKQRLRENTLVIGLSLERDVLRERIEKRVDKMITDGLVEEVEKLGEEYGWSNEAMSGIGYRFMGEYLRGEIDLDEAKRRFVQGDLSLAKRQRTWFKRNKNIHWAPNPEQAFNLVRTFLGKSRA